MVWGHVSQWWPPQIENYDIGLACGVKKVLWPCCLQQLDLELPSKHSEIWFSYSPNEDFNAHLVELSWGLNGMPDLRSIINVGSLHHTESCLERLISLERGLGLHTLRREIAEILSPHCFSQKFSTKIIHHTLGLGPVWFLGLGLWNLGEKQQERMTYFLERMRQWLPATSLDLSSMNFPSLFPFHLQIFSVLFLNFFGSFSSLKLFLKTAQPC